MSVISDVSNSVVASVPVGPFPGGIAYDPAKGEVFVSSAGSTSTPGSVSVISDATNAVVATVPLNDAGTATYDSARGELYVVTTKENSTTIISDSTNSVVGTKAAGPFPFYIAYDPAKGELFVSNPGTDTVTILSDASASSTSTTAPSSTATSSSSAFDPSYVLILAVNAAVLIALISRGRPRGSTPPTG